MFDHATQELTTEVAIGQVWRKAHDHTQVFDVVDILPVIVRLQRHGEEQAGWVMRSLFHGRFGGFEFVGDRRFLPAE